MKNKLFPFFIFLVMAISTIVIISSSEGHPTDTTTIRIVPSTNTVNLGQMFEINVEIEPSEPIRTVSFDLSFDPSLLQLNSISDGIFDIFVPGSIDNGFINGSASSMYGSGTINSPSVIATLIFTATNGGTSTLDLFSLTALDATGVPVTVVDHDGSVTVQTSVGPLTAYADGPYSGSTGQAIQFFGSASGGTPPYSYEWDFGDGNASNEQNPTHTYTYADTFTVILTVTDAESNIASDTTTVTASQNQLPSAYFTYSPAKAETGETVKFKDSSIDEDGIIVNWTWNFGDGNTSNERDPSHKYSKAGTYTVTLTVTDDYGDTDSYTRTITVEEEKKGISGFEFAFLIIAIASIILIKRRNQK